MISQAQALTLAERILRGALPPAGKSIADRDHLVRNLAARVGELEQALRSALSVIEAATTQAPEGGEQS
ncbi:hypothetical protein [Streptomyces sp. NPDC088847]|uniref:hypothetical protein n=1 Tax=Streptomyces sp. NPDC088847 TaxID=3365909 RepID=UPI0037FF3EBA